MFAVKKRGEEEGPKVENWLTVSKVTRLQKKSSLVTVWTNRFLRRQNIRAQGAVMQLAKICKAFIVSHFEM